MKPRIRSVGLVGAVVALATPLLTTGIGCGGGSSDEYLVIPEPPPPPPTEPPAPALPTPIQIAPPDGSTFDHVPRTTVFEWQPVEGASAYTIEIDCFHCCAVNQWCTDVGRDPSVVRRLTSPSYTLDWVGAQPGRWRVYATDAAGTASLKTGWWVFRYTR